MMDACLTYYLLSLCAGVDAPGAVPEPVQHLPPPPRHGHCRGRQGSDPPDCEQQRGGEGGGERGSGGGHQGPLQGDLRLPHPAAGRQAGGQARVWVSFAIQYITRWRWSVPTHNTYWAVINMQLPILQPLLISWSCFIMLTRCGARVESSPLPRSQHIQHCI